VGRVYPNGEFTLGYVAIEKKRIDDSRYERGEVNGIRGVSPEPDEVDTTLGSIAVPHEERLFSSINLAVVENHHIPSRKYGAAGITTYGKRIVRNSGFMLEQEFGRENLSMGTLTIPQFTTTAMRSICANWNYLVRAFFQEMTRIYSREGLTWRYCSVTEIQPKRWADHKQVGLHIHFLWVPVWVGWANQYLVSYNDIRRIWRRLLQNVINSHYNNGAATPAVPNPNFRDERVQKDASAYMAKYMSKGSDIVNEVISHYGEDWIPSQWWSADTTTKKAIKDALVHPTGDMLDALVDICEGNQDALLAYRYEITIERPQRSPLTVGYVGRLNHFGMSAIACLRSTA